MILCRIFGKYHEVYWDAHCPNSGVYSPNLFALPLWKTDQWTTKLKKQTNPWLDINNLHIKNSISVVNSFYVKSAVRKKCWKVRPWERIQLVRGEKEASSAFQVHFHRRDKGQRGQNHWGHWIQWWQVQTQVRYVWTQCTIPVRHLEDSYTRMSQPSGFGGILVLTQPEAPSISHSLQHFLPNQSL